MILLTGSVLWENIPRRVAAIHAGDPWCRGVVLLGMEAPAVQVVPPSLEAKITSLKVTGALGPRVQLGSLTLISSAAS